MLRIVDYYLLLVGTGMDELLGCLVLQSNNNVKLDNKHIDALNSINNTDVMLINAK